MSVIDIIIAALLLFGFIKGLLKGLFGEVASLVALVAGIYGSIHFSYFIKDQLVNHVSWEPRYISLASFGITFIIIVVSISLLGKILTKIADFAALGLINKILGGCFGALKIGLIMSVGLLFFDKLNTTFSIVGEEEIKESILFEPIKKVVPSIFPDLIKGLDSTVDNATKKI